MTTMTTTGTTRANGTALDVRHVGVDESSEIRSSSIQPGETRETRTSELEAVGEGERETETHDDVDWGRQGPRVAAK